MSLQNQQKLQNLILDRLDEESLYILMKNYPSLNIDNEFKKRLESCDKDSYIPVLDFFLENNIKKSFIVNSGLYNLRNSFPWRIGVVYDFSTGRINNIEIRVGHGFGRYKVDGKKAVFTWLDAFENKKMLREIISDNSKTSLFSKKMSKEKSMEIRDLILNNKKLRVDIAVINRRVVSFPGEQSLRENFVAFPYAIASQNSYIKLTDDVNVNMNEHMNMNDVVNFENVSISFSPEIVKYLSVISY